MTSVVGRSTVPSHGDARAAMIDDADNELELEVLRALRSGRSSIPVLPAVAQSALRIANDPTARIEEMIRLVDTDPPIAARFMSVANAVSFFRGSLATSTRTAIVRLGLANTRDLLFQVVYASSTGDIRSFQYEVQASFRRSVATAVASRVASRVLGGGSEFDYMCGLLHDIGEARVYRILDARPLHPSERPDVEKAVRKYHCRAGADLAEAWRLPPQIVDACAHHEDANGAARPHVRLVMIADATVDALEMPEEARDTSRLAALGVADADAARLLSETRAALSDAADAG